MVNQVNSIGLKHTVDSLKRELVTEMSKYETKAAFPD
jgi:hypothetical protein